jgi:AraC-like DNA-binding protein
MADEPSSSIYRERAPRPELRDHLASAWSLTVAIGRNGVVIPDGCMDIVWREGLGLVCAGPDTGPVRVSRPPGSTVVGIRFRPGAGPAMLGQPASELRDLRVPLAELWGAEVGRLEERLADAASTTARQDLLQDDLARRLEIAPAPDPVVGGAVALLRANGLRRVNGLGDAIGISERQLRRRFHSAVGYGPKRLARVLRLQRMLDFGAHRRAAERQDLARLALESGYADQAHMTAECTRLAGQPPARLLASRWGAAASP